jgi:hypothetical protein
MGETGENMVIEKQKGQIVIGVPSLVEIGSPIQIQQDFGQNREHEQIRVQEP